MVRLSLDGQISWFDAHFNAKAKKRNYAFSFKKISKVVRLFFFVLLLFSAPKLNK